MHVGSLVFAQLMDLLPLHAFHRSVERYEGQRYVKSFSCLDQFLVMAFAQLTFRESLRDVEACLSAVPSKLYHMGIRSSVSRSTLSDANESRDWRIFADFAQALVGIARRLYRDEDFGLQLNETVYALDATTIDLCLALFPWAKFRQHKGAVKLHTLLDLRGNIPSFIHITDGKVHDINVLDVLIPEPGSFYVMDRGYLDFARLYGLTQNQAFFVVRSKENLQFRRLYSRPIDKSTGLRCDRTLNISALPGETAPGRIFRCDEPEALFLPEQQLCTSSPDDYAALQMQMASGTVLQVDKTAPAHQGLFRNHGECCQDSSLDRSLRLCVGGDSQKAAQFGPQPLHNFTDFEPHAFRESPNLTSTYRIHEYDSGAR